MKKLSLTLLVGITLASSGCSSIRMRYDAEFKAPDGKTGKYRYEQSYDVGSYPALCGLTAIFFGGACWFYTVMPTVNQHKDVERDAARNIAGKLGAEPEILYEKSKQAGWGDSDESSSLTWD